MTYICVAEWDSNNVILAEGRADTEDAAQANVAIMVSEGYSNAFYAELPSGSQGYLRVSGSSVVVDTDQEAADALAAKWAEVRSQRDQLLAASDYTQVADAPGDTAAWATYRQALRDVPSQSDVDNITWPQEPS
jgi:hypothetical protein